MTQTAEAAPQKQVRSKPLLKQEIGMILMHLVPLAAIWTGATLFDWIVCISLYFIRMFFVTGGYHRYFSHRSYKTSRPFQFFIAFMAETSAQKGVLWWAAHHRHHHKHSDTPEDPHSMKWYGFWYSHIGWIIGPDFKETNFGVIQDFAKHSEIRWIDKHYLVPPTLLAIVIFLVGGFVNGDGSFAQIFTQGWSSLLIGFFLSTVLLYHGTFSINSIMHKFGKARYNTGDESKNSLVLALVTLGEGWHNNHHYYQVASRNGFFWWEIDITYYVLKTFSVLGLVWDLKGVPHHIKYSKTLAEAREKMRKEKEQLG
ncbi:acyl-CoA desaturase [Rapidithrix thailandica]|uniref:Acyl-CoA desaturase n=1 Tax=Rapidithrix thailandica TaxID=413964 RepID=A0AAW9SA28_9BACT